MRELSKMDWRAILKGASLYIALADVIPLLVNVLASLGPTAYIERTAPLFDWLWVAHVSAGAIAVLVATSRPLATAVLVLLVAVGVRLALSAAHGFEPFGFAAWSGQVVASSLYFVGGAIAMLTIKYVRLRSNNSLQARRP